MKRLNFKNSIICPAILFATLLSLAGCKLGGLVSLLGTESYHEQKIPAEFDFSKQTDKKILVLVDQPAWALLNSQADLRYYLTKAIRTNIMIQAELKPENLLSYDKLVKFRSSQSDFSSLSPIEIGKAMDANMVLLVLIEDYQLNEMSQSSYLMGNLNTRVILYDAQTGEKLWPQQEASRSVRVSFDVETKGVEVAVSRLTAANAFCTTRYFYDCPKAKFRIYEDRTREGAEGWESLK